MNQSTKTTHISSKLARSASKKSCQPELWRDVPGYAGLYQISTSGNVAKLSDGKRARILKPSRTKPNEPLLYADLKDAAGKRSRKSVSKLVFETFVGPVGDCVVIHKNGLNSDNSLNNLALASRAECGKRCSYTAHRRPVVKINVDGDIVECYPSARAAAKNDYVDIGVVCDRCNGKIKDEYAFTGYSYRWDV